jgi:hypothetical protein
MVSLCLMCVFVHSCFVENPLIDLEVTNPSFLRWFYHTLAWPTLSPPIVEPMNLVNFDL